MPLPCSANHCIKCRLDLRASNVHKLFAIIFVSVKFVNPFLLLRGHPERSYLFYLYGRKNLDMNQVSRDEFMRKWPMGNGLLACSLL